MPPVLHPLQHDEIRQSEYLEVELSYFVFGTRRQNGTHPQQNEKDGNSVDNINKRQHRSGNKVLAKDKHDEQYRRGSSYMAQKTP